MTWDDVLSVLPLAIISALVVAFVVCLIVFLSYKKKNRAPSYPLSDFTDLELTYRSDIFIGSHVTRIRVQSRDDDRRR